MAKSNKIETKDLRKKLIENLAQVTAITKKVDWSNYQKAFNSMDDYVWIRISPKVHYAQPMGFSTREKERGRSGAYQVYVNPNIPKQFQVPVEMHEWGHILYTHLTFPQGQRNILINKIRSYWPEIKLHLSDEVLKRATDDPKYGDYLCDRLCNCILNIAMDFEVNSKLFEDFEKDDLIQYLSIAGCYSLAYASESSVEGLERALRWTEYQLGIRVPKEGKKVTPLFMPCLPEDVGMPRGLEFEKYIDYMIIHDDEFFQYAKNSLSNSTGLSGSPNTPQNQTNEDSGDEIDDNDSSVEDISDSSDYGKESSSNDSGNSSQGQSSGSSLPELATEKNDHQFDKDGGGMEDWNPSNDDKNAQQQQQQQQNGANGNSNSQDTSDQGNTSDTDASDTQSDSSQSDTGNDTDTSSNTNEQDGQNSQDTKTDSLGRPIDDSHLDEDEIDVNDKGSASDLSSAFDEDEEDSICNNASDDTDGSQEDSDSKDKGKSQSGNGKDKLTPEQIDNIIKAYDDSNLDNNQERIDEANKQSNSSQVGNGYSPVGSNNNGLAASVGSSDDIIEIGRTDKLEKFIVQCCFNKHHTNTRVDSMYYYNRRKFNSNRIITKKRTENRYKPGNVYVLVDVSGSVNEQSVNTIIQTVRKVANKCGHNSRVVFWDTDLCGDYPLNKIGKVPCGGGTFMSKGIAYIREHYLHKSNDKLIIVSDFCDSLYHWNEEVKKLKGEAFGICWAEEFDKDISSVKEYVQDNSFGSDDYSVIDNLLKSMPTIIVDISQDK